MTSPDPILATGTDAPAAESPSGKVGSAHRERRTRARVELMHQMLPDAQVELTGQVR